MCSITLLWSTDLEEKPSFADFLFSRKNMCYKPSFLAHELDQSDIAIDVFCSSQQFNAVKTALDIKRCLNNTSLVYSLPFINEYANIDLLSLTNLGEEIRVLKQIEDVPDFYKYPSNLELFEKHVLPLIKNLIWLDHYSIQSEKERKMNYNVLIVSHTNFIKDNFNFELKPGQVLRQTYQYKNITDKKPCLFERQYIPYFKTKKRTIVNNISKIPFLCGM
jgi:hypothetical protein